MNELGRKCLAEGFGTFALVFAGTGAIICGASMNPARSLAPAIFTIQLHIQSLYIIAPKLGALSGVLLHRIVYDTS